MTFGSYPAFRHWLWEGCFVALLAKARFGYELNQVLTL